MFDFRKKGKTPDSSAAVSTTVTPAAAEVATETAEADAWFGKKWFKSKADAAEAAPAIIEATIEETIAAEPAPKKPWFGKKWFKSKAEEEPTEIAPQIAPPAAVAPAPAPSIPKPAPLPPPINIAAALPETDDAPKFGVLSRLRERLARTRSNLGDGLGTLFLGRKRIDDELMEELETLLITADVGVTATARIIADLTERVKRKTLADPSALLLALKADLRNLLLAAEQPVRQPARGKPQVILMVGVNGAGKTTTIGKLAKRLQLEGNSVMLAAGDTFRAAAVEQLEAWGERNQIPVIAQHTGADSASVIFDALQAATARGVDVLIADTAGRLHTKTNLMEELSKVARVLKKIDAEAPHEVMLVVDATTGQNAIHQAEHFHRAVGLTGITLTKLDGTAKGGIVFAIAERLQLPIRFIGVGESIDDLRPFDADEFLTALLS